MFVHAPEGTKPVMTGFAPAPHEAITIGKAAVPDLVMVMVPVKVSPHLNNTESPGFMLVKNEFNLVMVCQGVALF